MAHNIDTLIISEDIVNHILATGVIVLASSCFPGAIFNIAVGYPLSTLLAAELLRKKYTESFSKEYGDAARDTMINSSLVTFLFGVTWLALEGITDNWVIHGAVSTILTLTALPLIWPIIEMPLTKIADQMMLDNTIQEQIYAAMEDTNNAFCNHVQRLELEVQGTSLENVRAYS